MRTQVHVGLKPSLLIFLSEHEEGTLRIIMEEESWTLTSAREIFL